MTKRSISSIVKKALLITSGGYCCNPGCCEKVYEYRGNDIFHSIGENAHIEGFSENGPRGSKDAQEDNSFDNLLILCPNCHTKVDKYPSEYPKELLYKWKKDRIENIKSAVNQHSEDLIPVPQSIKLESRFEEILYGGSYVGKKDDIMNINKILTESYNELSSHIKNPCSIVFISDKDMDSNLFELIVISLLKALEEDTGNVIYYAKPENKDFIMNELVNRKDKGRIIFVTDIDKMQGYLTFPINPKYQSVILFISDNTYSQSIPIRISSQQITPFLSLLGSR